MLGSVVKGVMEGGGNGDDSVAGTAMEVEAEASLLMGASGSPTPTLAGSTAYSARRLGLRNSIQTNFGDDYVFQIASWYMIPFRQFD
jgi:hypothetical protein